jgi:hypothetical protein
MLRRESRVREPGVSFVRQLFSELRTGVLGRLRVLCAGGFETEPVLRIENGCLQTP